MFEKQSKPVIYIYICNISVGKTSLITRFMYDSFDNTYQVRSSLFSYFVKVFIAYISIFYKTLRLQKCKLHPSLNSVQAIERFNDMFDFTSLLIHWCHGWLTKSACKSSIFQLFVYRGSKMWDQEKTLITVKGKK